MGRIFISTMILGALPLLAVTLLQVIVEKLLKISSHIKEKKENEIGFILYFMQFLSDLLFFVVIPSLVYYWIYPIMPFVGYKAGVAVALGAYILGSLPYATNLSLRVKIPAIVIVSTLFFNLLKLAGAMGVITHYLNY
jgi:hypothetical protein